MLTCCLYQTSMTFDFLALLGGENRTRLGLAPEMNAGVCNLHRRGEATNLRQKRRSRRRCFHNQWGKLPVHASASISIRIILSLDHPRRRCSLKSEALQVILLLADFPAPHRKMKGYQDYKQRSWRMRGLPNQPARFPWRKFGHTSCRMRMGLGAGPKRVIGSARCGWTEPLRYIKEEA
jgi:hypothetical protein